jgi:Fe-S cluster biogenesis protein NfuA
MVPLHPRAQDGDPASLIWVVPAEALPFTGPVATAPAPLAALLDDGALAEVRLTVDGVVTRLGPGRSWAETGPRVRTALHAALENPDGWASAGQGTLTGAGGAAGPGVPAGRGTSAGTAGDCDAGLEVAARELLDGPVGAVAGAHGGGMELVDVRDGVVRVRLAGACRGCPAVGLTVGGRLAAELRRRPGFRAIETTEADRADGAPWWRRALNRRWTHRPTPGAVVPVSSRPATFS